MLHDVAKRWSCRRLLQWDVLWRSATTGGASTQMQLVWTDGKNDRNRQDIHMSVEEFWTFEHSPEQLLINTSCLKAVFSNCEKQWKAWRTLWTSLALLLSVAHTLPMLRTLTSSVFVVQEAAVAAENLLLPWSPYPSGWCCCPRQVTSMAQSSCFLKWMLSDQCFWTRLFWCQCSMLNLPRGSGHPYSICLDFAAR